MVATTNLYSRIVNSAEISLSRERPGAPSHIYYESHIGCFTFREIIRLGDIHTLVRVRAAWDDKQVVLWCRGTALADLKPAAGWEYELVGSDEDIIEAALRGLFDD